MAMDSVRIRNLGKTPFKDKYANQPYVLPAGDVMIVPWDAVCLWFGNPEKQDLPAVSKYERRDEYQRVLTRMGCYDGDGSTASEKLKARLPRVKVETFDGEEIVMLINDPEGRFADRVIKTGGLDSTEALAKELESLKRAQAELLRRLEEAAQPVSIDELPADVPTKVPVDNG